MDTFQSLPFPATQMVGFNPVIFFKSGYCDVNHSPKKSKLTVSKQSNGFWFLLLLLLFCCGFFFVSLVFLLGLLFLESTPQGSKPCQCQKVGASSRAKLKSRTLIATYYQHEIVVQYLVMPGRSCGLAL